MEANKQIAIGGTNHLKSADNGSLAHMINVRPERGVLRPITSKLPLQMNNIDVPVSVNSYDRHFLHKNAEFAHWIGVSAVGSVEWYNANTGAVIAVIGVVPGITKILSLKNFLILITPDGLVQYLYIVSTNTYTIINVDVTRTNYPDIFLSTDNLVSETSSLFDVGTTTAALIDAIYKIENTHSAAGKMIGGFWYRWALRLYDGSHIMPSCPQFITALNYHIDTYSGSLEDGALNYRVRVGHSPGDMATAEVWYSDLLFNYNFGQLASLDAIKDVVVGIDIFACKPVRSSQIDKMTVANMAWLGANHINTFINVNNFTTANAEINIQDMETWYLLQKFTMAELATGNVKTIDTKDFWNNWSSRELMTADSASWQGLEGKTGMVYNGRVMLGDISTTLLKSYQLPGIKMQSAAWDLFNLWHMGTIGGASIHRFMSTDMYIINRPAKIITTLSTDEGLITVVDDTMLLMFEKWNRTGPATWVKSTSQTELMLVLPGTISYPDYRAKEIKIAVEDGLGTLRLIETIKLSSANNNNFSYATNCDYTASQEFYFINAKLHAWREILITIDGSGVFTGKDAYVVPNSINTILSDQNRVIASGLNNPLTWAADNSYRVGNGRVVAIGANTEQLSQGQFGEHPVLVFSSEGIFGLMQGNFPVLFQSVSPLAGDICLSDNLLPLRNSIIFLGERGVTAISGKQTTVLSEILNGTAFNPISGLNIYDQMVTDARLSNSHGLIMAETDIREYLDANTCLAYDHKRDELIVFTPGKLYSWFFSFINSQWYKCSQNWKSSINAWPDSYVQHNSGQILDLTLESDTATAEIFIQTNPVRMGGYVGIDDLSLYGDITPDTGKYTGIYLFGAEMEDNYFAMGGTQTAQRLRTYKSNSFSRIKVSNLLLILSSISDNQTFITPVFNLNFKPKFNQIKS